VQEDRAVRTKYTVKLKTIVEEHKLHPLHTSADYEKAVLTTADVNRAFGIKVSHSHRRSNRTWKPNVKRVKAIVDGSPKHVYVCTRCLRSGKVTRAV